MTGAPGLIATIREARTFSGRVRGEVAPAVHISVGWRRDMQRIGRFLITRAERSTRGGSMPTA